MKDFKIQIPEGYTIDTDNSDLTEGVIKFKKVDITDWKSFIKNKKLKGCVSLKHFYIDELKDNSLISDINTQCNLESFKEYDNPIFANIEEARSLIALMKLMLVRSTYIGDWKPNWDNYEEDKYSVEYRKGKVYVDVHYTYRNILSFPTQEMAELFIENNRELILKYYSF